MSAKIRLEVAAEQIAALPSSKLKSLLNCDDVLWRLACQVNVPDFKLQLLMRRELFSRGDLRLCDLHPKERRDMVAHFGANDLLALAAGPIMDIGNIYLPAGKLSMAETRERERRNILP